MDKKHLYLLPGLGADERLFQYIEIPDCQLHFLQYPIPKKEDTLEDFIIQLSKQITAKPYAFLACSIGGIFAIELERKIPVEKIILVASIKSQEERPFYFDLLRKLPVHRWLPMDLLKRAGGIASKLGGKHEGNHLDLLAKMLQNTDNALLIWGVDQIVAWNPEKLTEEIHNKIVHIHGKRDLIFPARFIKNAVLIPKAAHFSILLSRVAIINELIINSIKNE